MENVFTGSNDTDSDWALVELEPRDNPKLFTAIWNGIVSLWNKIVDACSPEEGC